MIKLYSYINRETENSFIEHLSFDECLKKNSFEGLDGALLSDKEFVLKILPHITNKDSFYCIDYDLQIDYDILSQALFHNMLSWRQIPKELEHDEHLATQALLGDIDNYLSFSNDLTGNKNLAIEWIHLKKNAEDLMVKNIADIQAYPLFNLNSDLVISVCEKHFKFLDKNNFKLMYLFEKWGHDADIMRLALDINPQFCILVKKPLSEDMDFFLELKNKDIVASDISFPYFDNPIHQEYDLLWDTIQRRHYNISIVKKEDNIFNNKEFLVDVLSLNYKCFCYFSQNMKSNSHLADIYVNYALDNQEELSFIHSNLGQSLQKRLKKFNINYFNPHGLISKIHDFKVEDFYQILNEHIAENEKINKISKINKI